MVLVWYVSDCEKCFEVLFDLFLLEINFISDISTFKPSSHNCRFSLSLSLSLLFFFFWSLKFKGPKLPFNFWRNLGIVFNCFFLGSFSGDLVI